MDGIYRPTQVALQLGFFTILQIVTLFYPDRFETNVKESIQDKCPDDLKTQKSIHQLI
jgi:hypothetical protein